MLFVKISLMAERKISQEVSWEKVLKSVFWASLEKVPFPTDWFPNWLPNPIKASLLQSAIFGIFLPLYSFWCRDARFWISQLLSRAVQYTYYIQFTMYVIHNMQCDIQSAMYNAALYSIELETHCNVLSRQYIAIQRNKAPRCAAQPGEDFSIRELHKKSFFPTRCTFCK